jgi:hypothetical protein
MAIIFVSVEVPDAELDALLGKAAQSPSVQQQVQSVVTQAQPQQDPWLPPQNAQAQPQTQQSYAPPAPQQMQQGPPMCAHGPMRYVPAGFSQRTNKAYAAFYGCQAAQGDPNKCKSVPA